MARPCESPNRPRSLCVSPWVAHLRACRGLWGFVLESGHMKAEVRVNGTGHRCGYEKHGGGFLTGFLKLRVLAWNNASATTDRLAHPRRRSRSFIGYRVFIFSSNVTLVERYVCSAFCSLFFFCPQLVNEDGSQMVRAAVTVVQGCCLNSASLLPTTTKPKHASYAIVMASILESWFQCFRQFPLSFNLKNQPSFSYRRLFDVLKLNLVSFIQPQWQRIVSGHFSLDPEEKIRHIDQ